jgi:hypothetical protein
MTVIASEVQAQAELEREISSAHIDPRSLETTSRSFLREVSQDPARLKTYREALGEAIKKNALKTVSSMENAAYLAVNLASPEGLHNLVEIAERQARPGPNDEAMSISIGAIRSFPDDAVRRQFIPQLIRWLRNPSSDVANRAFAALCSIDIDRAAKYLLIFVSSQRDKEEAIKYALADLYFLGGETKRGESIIKSVINVHPPLAEFVTSNKYLPIDLRNRIKKPSITGSARDTMTGWLHNRWARLWGGKTESKIGDHDLDRIGDLLKSAAHLLGNDSFPAFHVVLNAFGKEYADILPDREAWAIMLLKQARKNQWPHEASGCLPRGFAVIGQKPNKISKVLVAHCYSLFTFAFDPTIAQYASHSQESVYELDLPSNKADILNIIFREIDKHRLDDLDNSSKSYKGLIGEVEHVLRSLKENTLLEAKDSSLSSSADIHSAEIAQIAREEEESYEAGLQQTIAYALAAKTN